MEADLGLRVILWGSRRGAPRPKEHDRQQGFKTLLNGLIALAERQPPLSHGLVRSDR